MQTGWVQVGNRWYYLSGSGVMQTGWQKINNRWYYLNSSGVMQTGWVKVGKTWYYMNNNGVMQTGRINVDGTWYYLDSHGAWQDPNAKSGPTFKNGILIVNKKHPLPTTYNPGENPTAAAQVKKLISAMQQKGFDISNSYSGFRSYNYQKSLYEGYVRKDGKKNADTYSARPGHSEHQTGLAYDLKHKNGTLVKKTAEAKWISENAANYGFIVRYKAGKQHITGYQAEPWHLRYIGSEAKAIYKSGLTLEEYLGVPGGDYYNNSPLKSIRTSLLLCSSCTKKARCFRVFM